MPRWPSHRVWHHEVCWAPAYAHWCSSVPMLHCLVRLPVSLHARWALWWVTLPISSFLHFIYRFGLLSLTLEHLDSCPSSFKYLMTLLPLRGPTIQIRCDLSIFIFKLRVGQIWSLNLRDLVERKGSKYYSSFFLKVALIRNWLIYLFGSFQGSVDRDDNEAGVDGLWDMRGGWGFKVVG